MKKRIQLQNSKEGGFYAKNVEDGFLSYREGKELLRDMGLSTDHVPFSTMLFLRNRKAMWIDKDGQKASVSFKLKDNLIECFGSYKGVDRTMRLYREWDSNEDSEMIMRLESEAIGNLCMLCVYGKTDI